MRLAALVVRAAALSGRGSEFRWLRLSMHCYIINEHVWRNLQLTCVAELVDCKAMMPSVPLPKASQSHYNTGQTHAISLARGTRPSLDRHYLKERCSAASRSYKAPPISVGFRTMMNL